MNKLKKYFLFSDKEFEKAKNYTLLKVKCSQCEKEFTQKKKYILDRIRYNTNIFCSRQCSGKALKSEWKECKCFLCGKTFIRKSYEINRVIHNFCSCSCNMTYKNKNKMNGTRISKLEIWLQSELIKIYPQTEFVFNGIKAINAELDIYIPSLKLAFELNGIFHYEPIFGKDKLEQTKNNDVRKFAECANNNIGLCVIDTSGQKYFKIETSHKYLKIICDIINERMAVD